MRRSGPGSRRPRRCRPIKRQLELEGIDDVAELAIVGDADHVLESISALAASGVTELMADVFGSSEEQDRTREVLRQFPRERGPQ